MLNQDENGVNKCQSLSWYGRQHSGQGNWDMEVERDFREPIAQMKWS